jgi:hypothetical protein
MKRLLLMTALALAPAVAEASDPPRPLKLASSIFILSSQTDRCVADITLTNGTGERVDFLSGLMGVRSAAMGMPEVWATTEEVSRFSFQVVASGGRREATMRLSVPCNWVMTMEVLSIDLCEVGGQFRSGCSDLIEGTFYHGGRKDQRTILVR